MPWIFVVSAVPVVLAAIAQVTERIHLASAVTVLSTADPVREFENFATLDLLSGGRARSLLVAERSLSPLPCSVTMLPTMTSLFPRSLTCCLS